MGGLDLQERVEAPEDGSAAPTVVGTDRIQGREKNGVVLPGGRGQVEFALTVGCDPHQRVFLAPS